MATPPIRTKFELSGEKEFKAAITDINGSLRVLNSEMKLTAAKFDENADSVEALTAKDDVLNRQLLTQKEKVDALRAALQNSAEQYGEADSRTKRWQASLNAAETEVVELERKLKTNKEALDKASKSAEDLGNATENSGKKAKGFGDIAVNLTSKLGVELPGGVRESLNSLGGLNSTVLLAVGGFTAAAAAIGELEKKLIGLTKNQAGAADEILTLSTVTGMSTEAVQTFRYSAQLLDTDFSTIQGSMAKMIRSMSDCRDGVASSQDAWLKLGVQIYNSDGSLRDSYDTFLDTIDALGEIENATERDSIAMEVFGRSAQDLNPLIAGGSARIREMSAEAHEMGYILSNEQLQALGAVDDAMQRYNNSVETGHNEIALKFAPALEEFYEAAGKGIHDIDKSLANSGIITAFGALLELVTALKPAFTAIGTVLEWLSPAFKVFAAIVGTIADFINVILSAISGFLKLISGKSAKEEWDTIKGILFGTSSAEQRVYSSLGNASGDENFPGGLTWVGENGPEQVILPQGSRIRTAQESRRAAGGDIYYITIDAKSVQEFNDIVRIARDRRRTVRMKPATQEG